MSWLVRELTPGEILFASVDNLLPLALLLGVALVQSAERVHVERKLHHLLLAWAIVAVIFLFLDRRGAPCFLLEARSVFSLAASVCVLFASVAVVKLGVVHLAEDRQHYGRIRAAHTLLAVGVAGFIFAPTLAGRADALNIRGNMTALPQATVETEAGIAVAPVVFIGTERIYCMRGAPQLAQFTISPVLWERVKSIKISVEP